MESVRDVALVCFMRATGCWLVECAALLASDVDLDRGRVRVVRPSSMLHRRELFLPEWSIEHLRRWRAVWPETKWQFPVGADQGTTGCFRAVFARLRSRAGREISGGLLRRAAALDWLRDGTPVEEVKRRLGIGSTRYASDLLRRLAAMAAAPPTGVSIERRL